MYTRHAIHVINWGEACVVSIGKGATDDVLRVRIDRSRFCGNVVISEKKRKKKEKQSRGEKIARTAISNAAHFAIHATREKRTRQPDENIDRGRQPRRGGAGKKRERERNSFRACNRMENFATRT